MLIVLVAATASAGSAVAQDADLAVSVSGPATVNALGSITYRIVVTNNGPSTATSVAIRDDLPAGVKYVSASYGGMVSGTVSAPVETWPTVASLANGASLTRTVTMTVPVTGTLVNVCSATSTTADPTPANNDGSAAASRVTTTVIGVADLSVPSSTAEEVVALLKWCWDNRDISRYHEIFTNDFRFTFVSTDAAGNPYPDHSWTREDELTSASRLFVDGSPTQPVASEIALSLGDARFTTGFPGLPSPWHKQALVPLTLTVTRSDGSNLSASGQALFFLVRGDSAVLPQELIDRGFRPDSSRWYIERLVEVAAEDHAPVLTVPSVVSGKAGSAIMVGVTAADPDGDPITWWSAQGTPAARFTTGPEAGSATFTWTPTEADVGPHLVTFTAGNALPGSVVIAIYVLPPNQRPAASLVANPPTGAEPLVVTLDASGSIDRDGSIVAYQFDFGDGGSITQPSPVATHTYQAGTFRPTVTVTDNEGASASASATITAVVATVPNLVRNPSFEVDAAGWKAFAGSTLSQVSGGYDGDYSLQITGPEIIAGSFGVNDSPDWVRPTTAAGLRYRYAAWVRSPSGRGKAKLRVREYMIATGAKLGGINAVGVWLSPEWKKVEVDYTTMSAGTTLDFQVQDFPTVPGEVFLTDDISIRDITTLGLEPAIGEPDSAEDDEIPLQPTLHPSPIRTSAVLSFATARPGPLRVEILDLAGRRVRRLIDDQEAPPGRQVLRISATGDDGKRMAAGVYFYRIVAPEGVKTGRFVMLR